MRELLDLLLSRGILPRVAAGLGGSVATGAAGWLAWPTLRGLAEEAAANPQNIWIGIVAVVVLLIVTGGLVPRWIHNQRVRDYQRSLDKREAQVEKLIEMQTLNLKLVEDLRREVAAATRAPERAT